MTNGERLFIALANARTQAGGVLTREAWITAADRFLAAMVKERKKAAVADGAEQIYEAYPKHVGRDDALKAISKALKFHPVEYLLDKTAQFAACVAGWPSSYRYAQDGFDRCPHPSTFFNSGRYADDPREWRRAGARSAPNRPSGSTGTGPSEAEQALESKQMRERYLAMPEPKKGTLEHSLWLEARSNPSVQAVTESLTSIVQESETEQRLRHA